MSYVNRRAQLRVRVHIAWLAIRAFVKLAYPRQSGRHAWLGLIWKLVERCCERIVALGTHVELCRGLVLLQLVLGCHGRAPRSSRRSERQGVRRVQAARHPNCSTPQAKQRADQWQSTAIDGNRLQSTAISGSHLFHLPSKAVDSSPPPPAFASRRPARPRVACAARGRSAL